LISPLTQASPSFFSASCSQRSRAPRSAGTAFATESLRGRTHALVALGSALFVAIPVQTSLPLGGDSLSRVIQGVATGVGFLGAGEIFRDPGGTGRVHGLTSAAALWVTAALGIVAVCGSWVIISATTAFIMLILVLAPRLERRFAPRPGEDLR
jgi:putative Mg2+ transporter-C (MgtC) family protein